MNRSIVFFLLFIVCSISNGQGMSPNQGLYFDPAFPNQGFGVGISDRSDGPAALTLTWYTYTADGASIWYLGTADLLDNRASVTMSRFRLAEDGSVVASEVGTVDIEFLTPDRASMAFELNGGQGSQQLERILPSGTNTTDSIQTGLWFPPATPGWGLNWLKEGHSEAAILYIYDEQGQPTWAITDAVQDGRADLLRFAQGSCPTCPATAATAQSNGTLEREFLSASEAIGTIDLVADGVTWQTPDAELTTLTTTVDPLTEAVEAALYDGDYATGAKPAEVIDGAMAALLGGLAGPGGKGDACVTTTTDPGVLGVPVPATFRVTLAADGECVLPNGESVSGSIELDVRQFSLGLTGLEAELIATFNEFRRNGLLIADGPIAMSVNVGGVGSRLSGQVSVAYDQVLTGSGLADGMIEATLDGLVVTPGDPNELLSGQLVNSYLFLLDDFTLDAQSLDGTISIAHETTASERTSEIIADLQSSQGNAMFTITVLRTRQAVNGQNVLTVTFDSVGSARFGPYDVVFDQLLFVPALCTYYPFAGTLAITGPGIDARWTFDGSCARPAG